MEVWKDTSISSEEAERLENFIVEGYRVFDKLDNKVVQLGKKL